MSAILNGIRNPNCPDYNAHTGLSDWSCVNLIKFLAPSISCGTQTLETNIESVHQQDICRSELSHRTCNMIIVTTLVSGLISVRARPHESPCVLGPLLVETRTCRGYEECRALSCTMRNAEIDNEASGRKGCRSSMLEGGNFLAHCALGWVRKRMSQLNLISFI